MLKRIAAMVMLIGAAIAVPSVGSAQEFRRDYDHDRIDRDRERREHQYRESEYRERLERERREHFDRNRYRETNRGFYDRFGYWHSY
jgi:hypothetical protein